MCRPLHMSRGVAFEGCRAEEAGGIGIEERCRAKPHLCLWCLAQGLSLTKVQTLAV